MKKLAKILNKSNNKYLFKQNKNKYEHKLYEKAFKRQGLYHKIKSDQDFIDFEIIKTSYNNMKKIQNKFLEIKANLEDLWDVISYQEKNFLLYQELAPFMETLKHFYVDDKRYFIAYFDQLINAYYDHEMLMFDHENYRKFIYDFKKIVVSIKENRLLALQAQFSETKFIVKNAKAYVLFSEQVNRFYLIDNEVLDFGMSANLSQAQILDVANMILAKDSKDLMVYLSENELGKKRLLKRLKRQLRKI